MTFSTTKPMPPSFPFSSFKESIRHYNKDSYLQIDVADIRLFKVVCVEFHYFVVTHVLSSEREGLSLQQTTCTSTHIDVIEKILMCYRVHLESE
jgi:hypothetical protein